LPSSGTSFWDGEGSGTPVETGWNIELRSTRPPDGVRTPLANSYSDAGTADRSRAPGGKGDSQGCRGCSSKYDFRTKEIVPRRAIRIWFTERWSNILGSQKISYQDICRRAATILSPVEAELQVTERAFFHIFQVLKAWMPWWKNGWRPGALVVVLGRTGPARTPHLGELGDSKGTKAGRADACHSRAHDLSLTHDQWFKWVTTGRLTNELQGHGGWHHWEAGSGIPRTSRRLTDLTTYDRLLSTWRKRLGHPSVRGTHRSSPNEVCHPTWPGPDLRPGGPTRLRRDLGFAPCPVRAHRRTPTENDRVTHENTIAHTHLEPKAALIAARSSSAPRDSSQFAGGPVSLAGTIGSEWTPLLWGAAETANER